MNQNSKGIRNIALVSVLLAMAIAIDIITGFIPGLNLSMPLGGRLFNISLLPIILIGIFLGPKYGIIGAVLYGMLSFFTDGYALAYFASNLTEALIVFSLDYVIAFGVLGLSGFFKNSLDHPFKFIIVSSIVLLLRWLSATIVGAVLWAAYASDSEWTAGLLNGVGGNTFIYSGLYNIIYTLTTIFTLNAIVFLSIRQLRIIKGQVSLT